VIWVLGLKLMQLPAAPEDWSNYGTFMADRQADSSLRDQRECSQSLLHTPFCDLHFFLDFTIPKERSSPGMKSDGAPQGVSALQQWDPMQIPHEPNSDAAFVMAVAPY
jgi:hypothetical protein